MEADNRAVICPSVFWRQDPVRRGRKIDEGMKSLLQRDEYWRQRGCPAISFLSGIVFWTKNTACFDMEF